MRNGINHTLTSSSSFALGGPGKNIQTVGVEIGILEMHCTCRIFWLAWGWILPQVLSQFENKTVVDIVGSRWLEGWSLKGPLESFGNDLVILGPDPLDILACIHIEY
jgi:hypothetical protein